jgi:hypothetical protein
MNCKIDKITDFEFLATVLDYKKFYRIFWYPEKKEIRFWGESERTAVKNLGSFIKNLPKNA